MKKYLIKGLLALVAGGFAASCADKDVDYVPLAQQKSQAYEKAFEEMIGGKVDPNQDWGFESIALPEEDAATRAMTRATIDVNGNEWASKPEVTAAEARAVYNYVNMTRAQMRAAGHAYTETAPTGITNYYVTQVWGLANNTNDPNCIYSTYDNSQSGIVGPSNMDNLHIAMSGTVSINGGDLIGDWAHINNFNASSNTNYGGNTGVKDGGTLDFAYYNSRDRKYYNKWIIVDGANITDADGVTHTGKYYVCFDFIADKDVSTAIRFQYWNPYQNGGEWQETNLTIPGGYTAADAVSANLSVDINYVWDGSQNTTLHYNLGNSQQIKNVRVDNIIGGNMYVPANDIYTDWIIRIVSATPGSTTPTSETTTTTTQHIKKKVLVMQGRVFCEDLGTVGRKDIDFNDIVFDARIWRISEFDRVTTGSNTVNQNYSADKYEAEICLLAAGGTIPVKLAERNVHDIFQPAAGLTTMVNTVDDHADTDNWVTWENSSAERDPVTFTYDMTAIFNQKGAISLNDIPLEVLWTMGSSDDPSSGYGTMQSVGVLSANLGKVPHKICLPIGTVWPSERRSMDGAYNYFAMWAKNKDSYPEFYKNEGDQVTTAYLYTGKTTGLSLTDANGRSIETNYTSEQVVSSTSTSTVETILWEGSQTYTPESSNNNLTIASVTFNVGDKFRVYGTNGSGSERWITFKDAANQAIVSVNSGIDFSAKGYYSIKVETQDQASKFSKGPLLNIAAQDMTITKITKVSTSSN